MNRIVAVFIAAVAALAITAQGADAKWRKHHKKVDPRITAVEIGVGAASTAAYFAINDWNWKWNESAAGISQGGAIALTTVGCMAVSPIVATIVTDRQLTQREAHILAGSCLIPIIGGWLVNEAYNHHPEWEPGYKPHKVWKKKWKHAKK